MDRLIRVTLLECEVFVANVVALSKRWLVADPHVLATHALRKLRGETWARFSIIDNPLFRLVALCCVRRHNSTVLCPTHALHTRYLDISILIWHYTHNLFKLLPLLVLNLFNMTNKGKSGQLSDDYANITQLFPFWSKINSVCGR